MMNSEHQAQARRPRRGNHIQVTFDQLAIPEPLRGQDPDETTMTRAEKLVMLAMLTWCWWSDTPTCEASNLEIADAAGFTGTTESRKRKVERALYGSRGRKGAASPERGWVHSKVDRASGNRRVISFTSRFLNYTRVRLHTPSETPVLTPLQEGGATHAEGGSLPTQMGVATHAEGGSLPTQMGVATHAEGGSFPISSKSLSLDKIDLKPNDGTTLPKRQRPEPEPTPPPAPPAPAKPAPDTAPVSGPLGAALARLVARLDPAQTARWNALSEAKRDQLGEMADRGMTGAALAEIGTGPAPVPALTMPATTGELIAALGVAGAPRGWVQTTIEVVVAEFSVGMPPDVRKKNGQCWRGYEGFFTAVWEGRFPADTAAEVYRRTIAAKPRNPAAYFNTTIQREGWRWEKK